jgi:hypothetical protein
MDVPCKQRIHSGREFARVVTHRLDMAAQPSNPYTAESYQQPDRTTLRQSAHIGDEPKITLGTPVEAIVMGNDRPFGAPA